MIRYSVWSGVEGLEERYDASVVLGTLVGVGALSLVVSGQAPGGSVGQGDRRHQDREGEGQPVHHHGLRRRRHGRRSAGATPPSSSPTPASRWSTPSLPGWGPTILERVKSVTNKPITRVINTHTHGDHTGSNEFFGAAVERVVQENTKTNMARMDEFKGAKAKFLPNRTYKDKLTLGCGQGSDRPLPLRARPHQRRHLRGVHGAAHDARRRHVRVEGAALHRPRQRRHGGGASADADQGARLGEERGHRSSTGTSRCRPGTTCATSGTSTRTSWPTPSARSRRARAWTRRSKEYAVPARFKGYVPVVQPRVRRPQAEPGDRLQGTGRAADGHDAVQVAIVGAGPSGLLLGTAAAEGRHRRPRRRAPQR